MGVGRSDTDDDGGIRGEEMVSEQVGLHDVSAAPSAMGADVDGDGVAEHSNVHLGEQHCVTNSHERSDQSSPSLTIEVDDYEGADDRALIASLGVTETYALYGMDVSFHHDQTLSRSALDKVFGPVTLSLTELPDTAIRGIDGPGLTDFIVGARPPTDVADAVKIQEVFDDHREMAYMFVTTDGADHSWASDLSEEFDWSDEPKGVAATAGGEWTLHFGTVIMTEDHESTNETFRLQKTMTHEIGRLLGAGRNDDGNTFYVLPGEVYSGDDDDRTPERVSVGGLSSEPDWSAMTSRFQSEMEQPPIRGDYTPYSIEELLALEFDDISTQRECVNC